MVTGRFAPVTVTGKVAARASAAEEAGAEAADVDVVAPDVLPQPPRRAGRARAGAAAAATSVRRRADVERYMIFSGQQRAGAHAGPSPVARPLPRGSRTGASRRPDSRPLSRDGRSQLRDSAGISPASLRLRPSAGPRRARRRCDLPPARRGRRAAPAGAD